MADLLQLEKAIWSDIQTLSIRIKDHRKAVDIFANAQHLYYNAKGARTMELRAKGEPSTIIIDLVKEDKNVGKLRLERDIAKGLMDNYYQAIGAIKSSLSAVQSLLAVERAKIDKGLFESGD